MRVVTFTPQRVYRSAAMTAARDAVLSEIAYPTPDVDMVPAAMRVASIRWRHAAAQLLRHGWRYGLIADDTDETRLETLVNCRPAFAEVTPAIGYCHRAHICPYCYARRVAGVYARISAQLQLHRHDVAELDLSGETPLPATTRRLSRLIVLDDLPSVPVPPFRLLERRHEYNRPLFPADPSSVAAAARQVPLCGEKHLPREYALRPPLEIVALTDFMRQHLSELPAARRRLLSQLKPRGAVLSFVVEPWENCWHFEHRQLFVLDAGTEVPEEILRNTRGSIRVHDDVSAKTVSQAIRRTFAYPPRLLIGDHSLTSIFLNACHRLRLWEFYGILRGTNEGQPYESGDGG